MPTTTESPTMVRRQSGGKYAVVDNAVSTGNYFWVDSGQTTTGGDTAGFGKNPDAPFLTIDFAVSQCTANNGDIIYVMPGHAEVVAGAGGLDLDVEGITIIGIGNGSDQPTITHTAETSTIAIDAANVTIQHLHIIAGAVDVSVCIDVNTDDFTCRDCRFTESSGLNFEICIQDAAATASDRITIEDCYALLPDAENDHFTNFAGTGDGHIIRNNILMGDWGTACIGVSGEVTNCLCVGNLINNVATTTSGMIKFAAAATGICMNNLCGGGATQANGDIVADGMAKAENYYQLKTDDLNGKLDPVAT